jgi:hypothetical protein
MNKAVERWYSDRVKLQTTLARWGDWGRPVLCCPVPGETPRRSNATTWWTRAEHG